MNETIELKTLDNHNLMLLFHVQTLNQKEG